MSRRRRRPTTITKANRPSTAGAVQPAATFTADQAVAVARALTSNAGVARALPRNPGDGIVPFGPGVALNPVPINAPRSDSHRPEPRQWDYPQSWNLPGFSDRLVPWAILRAAADQIPLFRRCIQIRKEEITTLDWDVTLSKRAIQRAMETEGGSKQDVQQAMMKRLAPEIGRLMTFWEEPDRRNGHDFIAWASKALEEHFVLDALPVYPRMTRGGDPYSLEVLDGSTIKPLLDEYGHRPMLPNPAYQQILQGFPRGEFVADTTEDDGGRVWAAGTYPSDRLAYLVHNVRTTTPYGYSAVEQALEDGDVWLRRRGWIKAEYTDGVMPSGWLLAGEGQAEWDSVQLRQYEKALNDYYSGMTEARQRYRILPWGMKPHDSPDQSERFRPDYDLFLLKLVAGHFETTIAELGFTEPGGLGSAGWHEGQADVQDRKATRPTLRRLQSWCTRLGRQFLNAPPELEFRILGLESEDEQNQDDVGAKRVASGRATLNEDRDRAGLPRYDFEEADKPFISTGRGILFLDGASKQAPPGEMISAAKEIHAGAWNGGGVQDQLDPAAGGAAGEVGPGAGPGGRGGPNPVPPTPTDGEGLTKADRDWLAAQTAITEPGASAVAIAETVLAQATQVAKTDEVKAYLRWQKRNPNPRRPFVFERLTEAEAADVFHPEVFSRGSMAFKADAPAEGGGVDPKAPAPAQAWPGWEVDLALADLYAAIVVSALTGLITTRDLIAAWLTARSSPAAPDSPAGTHPRPDEFGHAGDEHTVTPTTREDARHWLDDRGLPPRIETAVRGVLTDVYTEGYLVGDRSATSILTGGPVEWGGWHPGHPTAARKLLSADGNMGLDLLLSQWEIPIKSIASHRLDELAAVLADGLDAKQSPDQMAAAVDALFGDRDWAKMVTLTELNRAQTAAAHDRYEEAHVGATEWMTALDDDVCKICKGNEAAGPVPLGERFPSGVFGPPGHPRCRCATLPALDFEGLADIDFAKPAP